MPGGKEVSQLNSTRKPKTPTIGRYTYIYAIYTARREHLLFVTGRVVGGDERASTFRFSRNRSASLRLASPAAYLVNKRFNAFDNNNYSRMIRLSLSLFSLVRKRAYTRRTRVYFGGFDLASVIRCATTPL